MYADPRVLSPQRTLNLGAALLMTGGIVAGMIFFLAPQIILPAPPGTIRAFPVPLPKDPPPIDQPKPKTDPRPTIDPIVVPPIQPILPVDTHIDTTTQPPIQPHLDPVIGTATVPHVEPPALPPLIAAEVDPRFARDLQPPYPAPELRLQREGTATVRLHIGGDGRVIEVQQVRATSPAFFDATRRQAMSKWRFRPAMRGGVAQDSWKTMTVTFVLTDAG